MDDGDGGDYGGCDGGDGHDHSACADHSHGHSQGSTHHHWDDGGEFGVGDDGHPARSLLKSETPKELLESVGNRKRLIAYVDSHPEFKRIIQPVIDANHSNSQEFRAALQHGLITNGCKEEVAKILSSLGAGVHLTEKHLLEEAGRHFDLNGVNEKAIEVGRRAFTQMAEHNTGNRRVAVIAGVSAFAAAVTGWVAHGVFSRNSRSSSENQR